MVTDYIRGLTTEFPRTSPEKEVSPGQLCLAVCAKDKWTYSIPKRLFDITVSSIAILAFLPLLAFVAALIWAEDRGPILYRQTRVGKSGKVFWFYKLRSMKTNADKVRAALLDSSDAEGIAFKMREDPRITRIGKFIRKFSIDEMPQLALVLMGEMSIIGPRPHLPSEVLCYIGDQYIRLEVKPGLLCLREISGRSKLNFQDWTALDVQYVQSRSLMLDLLIFFKAIPAVIKGDGAY